MRHRFCFEAVHLTLKDICSAEEFLFGGIPVVLRGDFAQTPPVIPRGKRPDIVSASLILSFSLWPFLKKLTLTKNMRLSQQNKDGSFLNNG